MMKAAVPRNSQDPPEESLEGDEGPRRRRLLSEGAIVVVAKCPIPGSPVKTRLHKLLGAAGSTSFARAMLCDVLEEVGSHPCLAPVRKLLLYAPGNDEGREHASELVSSIGMSHKWTLLPMLMRPSPSSSLSSGGHHNEDELRSPNLGDKLKDALVRVRAIQRGGAANGATDSSTDDSRRNSPGAGGGGGGIVFLGMDSPEIDAVEIGGALLAAGTASDDDPDGDGGGGSAHLCPAEDGGYGMLCVPPCAPPEIFDGVRWSTSLTAASQLKALGDRGVGRVRVGRLMRDVDEPDDVWDLARRLCDARKNNAADSGGGEEANGVGVGDAPGEEKGEEENVLKRGSFPSLFREASTCSEANGERGASRVEQRADRCRHTWAQLVQLGLVRKVVNGGGNEQYVLSKENKFP